MKLYLVRHGPAENQSRTGRDFDRTLTIDGRQKVQSMAAELGKRGEVPERIITSPLRRAVETGELIAGALDLHPSSELSCDLEPGSDVSALVARLLGERAQKVMLVGHEPDMSSLASRLLPGWSRGFDTAMVLGLGVDLAQPVGARARPIDAHQRFVFEAKNGRWVGF
jgi:phosphohistidine phosphatase